MMKAIRFNATIPRYAAGLAMGKLRTSLLWSGRSCTYVEDVPRPELIGPDWVRVRTRLGGICGSDLSAIHLHASPYFSALVSFPYTFGHENVGIVDEVGAGVAGWRAGQRVVVEPTLWCKPRGFEDLCEFCARGEINRCVRITEGALKPGLSVGNCADTSGSWSPYFLAHQSQLYAVPDTVSDANALMVEPFAVALHAALMHRPAEDETVLILGSGSIGLCMLAALRAVGCNSRIFMAARYPFQADAARKLGASEVLIGDTYAEVAKRTNAKVLKPTLGKSVVVGGVDWTFECVGSDSALDDSLRLTQNGGAVVVVGVPGIARNVDWTSVFIKELTVRASYIYNHVDRFEGATWKTFDLALTLMASSKVDLSWMVTHRFRLDQYDQALKLHGQKGSSGLIKAVFEFQ